MTPPAAGALPALREALNILPGNKSGGGDSWVIQDPARNAYFQIGWREFAILARWNRGDKAAVARAVQAETSLDVDEDDVEDVQHFLAQNELLVVSGSEALKEWRQKRTAARKKSPITLVQKTMFLRIPLIKPKPVLQAIEPLAEIFFRRGFWTAVVLAAVAGSYVVLRQLDSFLSGFMDLATLDSATYYIVAIVISKILHEFGHASTAHRYGIKVPTMGVAFMVFWPVLYSDTTDSWRLFDRGKRLRIAAAGVLVELALASFSLLAWGLLPDGPIRNGAFVLASVTWLMTLFINLNPLMKFDGYYLMSDWLEIDNLHPRAFAMGKWLIRKYLLGMRAVCPEPDLSKRRRRILIILCYSVWVYRLFLTFGIALLIYEFLFKALGIIIMVISVISMLGLPIAKEVKEIWMKRDDVKNIRRPVVTAAVVLLLLAGLIIPWQGRVPASALLQARDETIIYPPAPGRITAVQTAAGNRVEKDDVLFRMKAPQLDQEIKRLGIRVRGLAVRIARARSRVSEIKQESVLRRQFAAALAELEGIQAQRERLIVRAPVDGRIMEMSAGLRPGLWVGDDSPLAVIAGTSDSVAVAYLGEADVTRIQGGAEARFYPNAPDIPAIDMTVAEINTTSVQILADAVLGSPLGGDIPARQDKKAGDGVYVPENAVFRVRMDSLKPSPTSYALRGTVYIDGERRSLMGNLWRAGAGVFIRESGF